MLRLLVVDCEESIRFSLKEYFTLQRYMVDTAGDLEEAERLFETKPYDVVLQDLLFGITRNVDGLDFIKFIRGLVADTRIIVLTASSPPEAEETALRCGADAFFAQTEAVIDCRSGDSKRDRLGPCTSMNYADLRAAIIERRGLTELS